MKSSLGVVASLVFLVSPLAANDVVFLRGQVQMQDGSAPGRSVTIQLSCKGLEPVRQTEADKKKGNFYLKVERDEFNHIARTLPASSMDFNEGAVISTSCLLVGVLPGYESSGVELAGFTINKDLALPKIILKPKTAEPKQ